MRSKSKCTCGEGLMTHRPSHSDEREHYRIIEAKMFSPGFDQIDETVRVVLGQDLAHIAYQQLA